MRLYLRLAWRNIWRHRRRTLIVVISIAMSMALMMLYDGMMAGFENAIYANAIRVLGGNIQVHAEGYQANMDDYPLLGLPDDNNVIQTVTAQPNVIAASRRIRTGGMATSHEGAFGVSIIGIEPEAELPVSLFAQNISAGRYLLADDADSILIGKGMADAMDVTIGDRITLVGRNVHKQMRQRTMTVTGIYDIGMPEIEKGTIYISLAEAQDLYGLNGQSTEVAVFLTRLGQENGVVNAVQPKLNGYEMSTWETNFPEMQAAINSKNGVMDVFGVIIMVIAGIGILNLLLIAVYERTREIGVLGALGMKPGQISLLFLLEGAMMGLVGLVAGVALGLLFNILLGKVGIDYSQFSQLTEYTALISGRVYTSLGVEKLAQRSITVLVIAVLSAFYPAREAAHHEPAQALHTV